MMKKESKSKGDVDDSSYQRVGRQHYARRATRETIMTRK